MARFADLSPEEQTEYRFVARQMLRLAGSYGMPVVFGEPVWRQGHLSGATGFVLEIGARHFVITASHVLAGYEAFASEHSEPIWQVGNCGFDPMSRVAARDRDADVVALNVTAAEAQAIGATKHRQ